MITRTNGQAQSSWLKYYSINFVIAKGINCLLNMCFHVLVAECIIFYAYTGIAVHSFLKTVNSSNCFNMYTTSSNSIIPLQ